jgi:hypothetical protein
MNRTEDFGGRVADAGAAAASFAREASEAAAAVSDKGREAVESAKEFGTGFADFIDESIRTRPYTTLMAAGFLGFLYGAFRRR